MFVPLEFAVHGHTKIHTQVSVGQTGSPSMVYWWWTLLLVALVMEIMLDVFTLNSMLHVLLHWTNLSRSRCKRWQSDRDLTSQYSKQSSAKSRMGEDMSVTMSFMNTKNNNGPSTVSWGTPDNTGTSCDVNPSTTTVWVWLLRNDSTQPITCLSRL